MAKVIADFRAQAEEVGKRTVNSQRAESRRSYHRMLLLIVAEFFSRAWISSSNLLDFRYLSVLNLFELILVKFFRLADCIFVLSEGTLGIDRF